MWKYRKQLTEVFFKSIEIIENYIKQKTFSPVKKVSKKKKSKRVKPTKANVFIQNLESYNCFYSKKAIGYSLFGLFVAAIISLFFYYGTGGTVSSVFNNIENLISSSEYTSIGLFGKLNSISYTYRAISFFILPISIVLFFDKNRTKITHRCAYLSLLFIAVIVHFVIVLTTEPSGMYSVEFPLYIFYFVCYIITKNKNKGLFNCFWIPGTMGAVFHLLAAATILPAFILVLTVSNVAGVFLVADLFKEIRNDLGTKVSKTKTLSKVLQTVLCIAVCSHIFFHMVAFQSILYMPDSDVNATAGPFAGIQMTEKQYDDYSKSLSDLNYIKEQSTSDSPVYIAGWQNWMYLHLERPIGAHTAFYLISEEEVLRTYYEANPDNIPEYIYLPVNDYNNDAYYQYPLEENLRKFSEMFDYDMEELSNGILLKVTDYKLEQKTTQ